MFKKILEYLKPYANEQPRLMAVALAPIFLVGVPLTVFVVFPLSLLEETIKNVKLAWLGVTEPMFGALNSWSYALIKNEQGEW